MINAVGLDVCKDRVVAWEMHALPKNLRAYFKENKRPKNPQDDPLTFFANREGINKLLVFLKKLKRPVLVMEPSGIHYARLFARIAERHHIPVRWVGHSEVNSLKGTHHIKDKNDQVDAMLLAYHCLSHWRDNEFFVRFEPGPIAEVREICLQLQGLNRIQNPLINRLRQQLAHEFPEIALRSFNPSDIDGVSSLLAWLVDYPRPNLPENKVKELNTKYGKLWDNSVARVYGFGLSEHSRNLIDMILRVQINEFILVDKLKTILESTCEFEPYLRVFDDFKIGIKIGAVLLMQIYPFENFSSLAQFKSRLGFGIVEHASGDVQKEKAGRGSALSRSMLVIWVYSQITPSKRKGRSTTGGEEFKKVCQFYDARFEDFKNNPGQLDRRSADKLIAQQKQLIERVRSKEGNEAIALQMELGLQVLEVRISELIRTGQSLKSIVKSSSGRKGYKILVQNLTAVKAIYYLYWRLKRDLSS